MPNGTSYVYRIEREGAPHVYQTSLRQLQAWAKRNPGEMLRYVKVNIADELSALASGQYDLSLENAKLKADLERADAEVYRIKSVQQMGEPDPKIERIPDDSPIWGLPSNPLADAVKSLAEEHNRKIEHKQETYKEKHGADDPDLGDQLGDRGGRNW